jgi:hypothetical protein
MYGRRTQVQFLVRANYGVNFKKNHFAGEIMIRGFSNPGEGFFFLMKTVRGEGFFFSMKTVGAVLPPPA